MAVIDYEMRIEVDKSKEALKLLIGFLSGTVHNCFEFRRVSLHLFALINKIKLMC